MSSRVVAVVGVVAFGLSACGSDSGSSSESATTQESAAGADSAADAAEISILNFNFSSPVAVDAGGTVTVTNNDGVAHTWTSDDDLFDSGTLEPGSSFEFQFDGAGEFSFFCEIHPSMTGSVTVTG